MILVVQKSGKYEYVSYRESYWDPVRKKFSSRTIKNFGRLDRLLEQDPNILEKLRAELARNIESRQSAKTAEIKKRVDEVLSAPKNQKHSKEDNRKIHIGSCIYRQIWNRLDLSRKFRNLSTQSNHQFNLAEAVFYLTSSRILQPDSKLAQWKKRRHFLYGSEDLHLNHLYRAIDILSQHKDSLIRYLNRQIEKHYQRTVTVALYDVTTYFFESQNADNLRNFGFSKDNKVNQVQVVMGLLIDQNGIPIDYELFPGNTSEFGTMVPLIKKLKKNYNIDRVIVAADRGLNSGSNLLALREEGIDYVISYRLRSNASKIMPLIQDENGWIKSSYKDADDVNKYRITTETRRVRTIDPLTKQAKFVELTSELLLSYSPKRARKDAADRSRLVEKAMRYADNPAMLKSDLRRGGKNYLKVIDAAFNVCLDQERIHKAEEFDGYYGICYSDPNLSPAEVMKIHRSLWKIEESFRISKSLLEARPCFHWTENRIRGHFVVCYLALLLQRLLEIDVHNAGKHFSTESIVQALREAQLQEIQIAQGEKLYAKSETTGIFEELAQIEDLKVLSSISRQIEVKRALKLKEI